MTKWQHKCKAEWMKARQRYLTATDVKDLLPVTKTGRKRSIDDENYLKVFARKIVPITEDDIISTGAAARGHVLEPFAIDKYNEFVGDQGGTHLHHWDDIMVVRPDRKPGSLAFSPDAMSIPMEQVTMCAAATATDVIAPVIGEVKCYNAENHLARGYETDIANLEERWQIATAMAVCPSIEVAHLVFFNPSMKCQMFVVEYTAKDLAGEVEMVLEVEDNWLSWLGKLGNADHNLMFEGSDTLENDIIDSIIKREELNPEGERSVVR